MTVLEVHNRSLSSGSGCLGASQVAALIAVMPEQVLDALSREEIADLFAFLETEPK